SSPVDHDEAVTASTASTFHKLPSSSLMTLPSSPPRLHIRHRSCVLCSRCQLQTPVLMQFCSSPNTPCDWGARQGELAPLTVPGRPYSNKASASWRGSCSRTGLLSVGFVCRSIKNFHKAALNGTLETLSNRLIMAANRKTGCTLAGGQETLRRSPGRVKGL